MSIASAVERTIEMIHQEYSQLCAQAGHLQYEMSVRTDELDKKHNELLAINDKLKALNLEAASKSSAKVELPESK